ncbi:Alanine--tRNA ligase [Trichinella pseudospiralis]
MQRNRPVRRLDLSEHGKDPRSGWSGRDRNREGNQQHLLHPNFDQKGPVLIKLIGSYPVQRLETSPTLADSRGARGEALCPCINRCQFVQLISWMLSLIGKSIADLPIPVSLRAN